MKITEEYLISVQIFVINEVGLTELKLIKSQKFKLQDVLMSWSSWLHHLCIQTDSALLSDSSTVSTSC